MLLRVAAVTGIDRPIPTFAGLDQALEPKPAPRPGDGRGVPS